jgi:hypothetical protein
VTLVYNVALSWRDFSGGVAKTRLALQFAEDLAAEFAEGVRFVAPAPIWNLAMVETTIAKALGIKEVGQQPLLELLKAYLGDKHLLLLLDKCLDSFSKSFSSRPSSDAPNFSRCHPALEIRIGPR